MISDSEINITGAHFANLPCLPNISTVFTAEIFKRCTETFSLSNEPLTTSLPVVEFSAKAPDTNNFNLCTRYGFRQKINGLILEIIPITNKQITEIRAVLLYKGQQIIQFLSLLLIGSRFLSFSAD